MRRLLLISLSLAASIVVFAQGGPPTAKPPASGLAGHGPRMMAGDYVAPELDSILAELGDKKIGELSGNDLVAIQQKVQLAARKEAFVRRDTMMSFMMPGAGQFATGKGLEGGAYLLSHLAVIGGSLVGAYYLLPSDLRFDRLDYLNSPLSSIKTAWEGHSFMAYLPYLGVLAAGSFVDFHLRLFSAGSASREARSLVESGQAKLEPRFGPGFMGMKFRF